MLWNRESITRYIWANQNKQDNYFLKMSHIEELWKTLEFFFIAVCFTHDICSVCQLVGWRCMRRSRERRWLALSLWDQAAAESLWAVAHWAATAVQCLWILSLQSLTMKNSCPVTSMQEPVPSAAVWWDPLALFVTHMHTQRCFYFAAEFLSKVEKTVLTWIVFALFKLLQNVLCLCLDGWKQL